MKLRAIGVLAAVFLLNVLTLVSALSCAPRMMRRAFTRRNALLAMLPTVAATL
jgi:hypothetical protein